MDEGLLILVLSAAGYLFLAWFPHTRYRRNRWSGYHLLFLSFISGIALTLAGALLYPLLDRELFERQPAWLAWVKANVWDNILLFFLSDNEVHEQNYSRNLAFIFIGFALAVLAPLVVGVWLLIRHRGWLMVRHGAWLLIHGEVRLLIHYLIENWGALQIVIAQKAARSRGDFIEAELAEALEQEVLEQKGATKTPPSDERIVELLLENDAVYAGFVIECGVTSAEADTSVNLQLIYSGYWDKETGEPAITRDSGKPGTGSAPVITVPVRRIVSVEIIKQDSAP